MMRAGQLGLIPHATNPFQLAIELVTRSPVHHVITAVDEDTVVSAEIPHVRYRPMTHFPDAIWSDFDLPASQRDKITTFASAQVGKPYALGDDLLIGIALLARVHTPLWIRHHLNNDNHWQCAELADAAYWHAGINLFHDDRPASAVFPGSFIPIWKDYGWWPTTLPGRADTPNNELQPSSRQTGHTTNP